MTNTPGRDARDAALDLRASDADRERVAERLRDAAAHGRLTMDELDDRIDAAYSARTYAELLPLTKDLPAGGDWSGPAPGPENAPAPVTAPRVAPGGVGGTPDRRRWSVAVLSGARRHGNWVVPKLYNTFSFWGGVELDLREAFFEAHEVTIRNFTIMAGVEITVPEDVYVEVTGMGIMGAMDDPAAAEQPPPGARVLRVTGIAFMAGVSVIRKPIKQPRDKRG